MGSNFKCAFFSLRLRWHGKPICVHCLKWKWKSSKVLILSPEIDQVRLNRYGMLYCGQVRCVYVGDLIVNLLFGSRDSNAKAELRVLKKSRLHGSEPEEVFACKS